MIGEKAGGQLVRPAMVLYALAALSLPGAWIIGTVADRHVFFNIFTFHWSSPSFFMHIPYMGSLDLSRCFIGYTMVAYY
jgi:hypothetical protein